MEGNHWEQYDESGFQPLDLEQAPTPSAPSKQVRSVRIPVLATIGVIVVGLIVWGIVVQNTRHAALKPISTPPLSTTALVYSDNPPQYVTVRGVWGGAAIFVLEYSSGTVMKAVNVDTGRVMWTITEAVGTTIRSIGSIRYEDGKLGITATTAPTDPQTCNFDDKTILVVDAKTGDVVSSRTFIEECGTLDDNPTWTSTHLNLYHNGLLVVDRTLYSKDKSSASIPMGGSTLAYDQTDPETTLWQVDQDPNKLLFDVNRSYSWVKGGEWVLSQTGAYVSIEDGRVATGSPGPYTEGYGPPLLYEVNDVLITMTQNDWWGYAFMTGWADINLTHRLWTYTPPNGTGISQYTGCSSGTTYVIRLSNTNFTSNNPTLAAIDTATGNQLWSISDDVTDFGHNDQICTFIDDSHLLYISGTAGVVVDAATGAEISRTEGLVVTQGTLYDGNIVPCGNLTCLVLPDYDSSQREEIGVVTAVDFMSESVQVHWTERFRLDTLSVFPSIDNGRTIFIGKGDPGVYNITVM